MNGKGIYVEMAHHPQVVVDAMAGMEATVARSVMLQQVVRYARAGLLVVGFGGFFLAMLAELGGLIVVFFGLALVGIVLSIVSGRMQVPLLREHFDAGRKILHTLRDDTGRRGQVVGWLDLGGPAKKAKKVRAARSGGGKQKVYYRDPWLKVKFKLVDGNVLRLTLEDKVKTKAGSIVRHQTQFSAKLVVNPELYRVGAAAAGDGSYAYTRGLGRYSSAGTSVEDGVLVVKGAGPAKDFSARQVLTRLKDMYSQLEPTSPGQTIAGVDALGAEV